MPKEEEKKEVSKVRFAASAIPTQTQPVILDMNEKETDKQIMSLEEALVMILNNQEELKKLLD